MESATVQVQETTQTVQTPTDVLVAIVPTKKPKMPLVSAVEGHSAKLPNFIRWAERQLFPTHEGDLDDAQKEEMRAKLKSKDLDETGLTLRDRLNAQYEKLRGNFGTAGAMSIQRDFSDGYTVIEGKTARNGRKTYVLAPKKEDENIARMVATLKAAGFDVSKK